ncbi:hypothetical protein [Ferroglobus placidus]|uniref:hypothetical protein n=1 Tax=Ferroglobus placidus TaxID=54261 RepID=UPI0001B742F6|nr:hypothetical protein [Ferroglobus placidus]
MRLVEYILRFERHLEGAKNLKSKDVRDYFVYNTLAMECLQAEIVNLLEKCSDFVNRVKEEACRI